MKIKVFLKAQIIKDKENMRADNNNDAMLEVRKATRRYQTMKTESLRWKKAQKQPDLNLPNHKRRRSWQQKVSLKVKVQMGLRTELFARLLKNPLSPRSVFSYWQLPPFSIPPHQNMKGRVLFSEEVNPRSSGLEDTSTAEGGG